MSIIFAAQTRTLDFSEEIFVWKQARDTSIGWEKVFGFLRALVVLGCLAFLYQNLGGTFSLRVLRRAINM